MHYQDRAQLRHKADAVVLAYVSNGDVAARRLAMATGVQIDRVGHNVGGVVTVWVSNSVGSASASATP